MKERSRFFNNKYHDAMAIVRQYGNPDFFITFTANPSWPEIVEKGRDRPDIVSRVFQLRLKQFLLDLKTFFGRAVAHISVIEFQKRGLPHAHILIIVEEKPNTAGILY